MDRVVADKSGRVILALGYDYTVRFIGSDSFQTCSFVSERFHLRQIAPPKTSLNLTNKF